MLPRYPQAWNYPSSANPKASYTLLNRESSEFIRFVNPSDYRVARQSCGACHLELIHAAERSLMSTSAMLWGGDPLFYGFIGSETDPSGWPEVRKYGWHTEFMIDNQLYVNQMSDLKDSFKVTQYRGDYVVTVRYERELNLGYETKMLKYERSVTLE